MPAMVLIAVAVSFAIRRILFNASRETLHSRTPGDRSARALILSGACGLTVLPFAALRHARA